METGYLWTRISTHSSPPVVLYVTLQQMVLMLMAGRVMWGRASQALGEADSWGWKRQDCWNGLSRCWKLCLKTCSPPLHRVCRRRERCMAWDAQAETCANCRLRWLHWAWCRNTGHECSAWFCSGPWGRLCVRAHVLPGRLRCDGCVCRLIFFHTGCAVMKVWDMERECRAVRSGGSRSKANTLVWGMVWPHSLLETSQRVKNLKCVLNLTEHSVL